MSRAAASLFALPLALAACTAESGIIIAVSGSGVEEVQLQIARGEGQSYFLDEGVSAARYDVRGRNLRESPYEVMLHEEGFSDAPALRVLALGYSGGKATLSSLLEPPQAFVRGELLRRNLVLGYGAPSPQGKGCYVPQLNQKSYPLLIRSDQDCDGAGPEDTPPDCNDADPAIYPKATERCDGKENNCDGKRETSEACYGKDGETCREGTRSCDDAPGKGLLGGCELAGGAERPQPYCWVYATCDATPSPAGSAPLACLGGRLARSTWACTLAADASGSCAVSRELTRPFDTEKCRWVLTSDGGLGATLSGASGTPPTSTTCAASLSFPAASTATSGTVTVEFYDESNAKQHRAALIEVAVTAKPRASCGEASTRLSCVQKQ